MPVMADEVVRYLLENNGTKFLDCTAGAGGHIAALLSKASHSINVFGIDIDDDAVLRCRERFAGDPRVSIEKGDYGNLVELVEKFDVTGFDGILADFGQSSDQIASPTAGLSFMYDAPLDMRFDRTKGEMAEEFLNNVEYAELKKLLKEIGQETNAAKIASAIMNAKPLKTTGDLERAIRSVTPSHRQNKVLARCFMVIRTIVNDELGSIERFLKEAPGLLKTGGRLVCISFDSNMDSRVKNAFRSYASSCVCPPGFPVCVCSKTSLVKVLTPRAIKPGEAELKVNNRSRSASLRVCEKI